MAKTYYTIQGDMWDGIAKKLYDDESGVNALLEANQQYADIVVFQQVLFWMCRIMKSLPQLVCYHHGGVKWKHVEYRRS